MGTSRDLPWWEISTWIPQREAPHSPRARNRTGGRSHGSVRSQPPDLRPGLRSEQGSWFIVGFVVGFVFGLVVGLVFASSGPHSGSRPQLCSGLAPGYRSGSWLHKFPW